ncbi:imm11 family protein [Corallococcus sp. 4LFB]|uniref:imm11 family protein n=1 Tax=Corallococcus sp. 4LFB TaxID=3383249 RepID=UPI0039748CB4
MPRRYFRLLDDVIIPGRWELGIPRDAQGDEVDDPWMFREGQPVPPQQPLSIPVEHPGTPLDFSLAGFSTPVVHPRVAALLSELAAQDIQLVSVNVQGHAEPYFILVATRLIRCIDDAASEEVIRWTPQDGRPDRVGQYRDVDGMRIDPTQVGDARVFRTWGWSIALIVSEDIKLALERIRATGTRFTEV